MCARHLRRLIGAGWLPLALLMAGCADQEVCVTCQMPALPSTARPAAGESAPDATSAVTLEVVDRAGFEKVLTDHRGEVILVDFWATWCAPCLKQFPHSVELYEKFRERGLTVITVSFDEPESEQEALEFLRLQNSTCVNLRSQYGFDSHDAFDIETGALPHFRLYDRAGQQRQEFWTDADHNYTAQDIDAAVLELLAEGEQAEKEA